MKYLPLLFVFFLWNCSPSNSYEDLPKYQNLIPTPKSMIYFKGGFLLDDKVDIVLDPEDKDLERLGTFLNEGIQERMGSSLRFRGESSRFRRAIILNIIEESTESREGYTLQIEPKQITVSAKDTEGLFRGIQSLEQMIRDTPMQEEALVLSACRIEDESYYAYRGAMLDVSRHFFSTEEVKKYIDYMAMYKMNFLHLHLSDDQGWRIEIEGWPALTEVGGATEVGGGKGGYFTKQDYRELVEYAADHFITIIPEIDMPGHTNAALVSYAQLNCDNQARKSYTGTEVGFSSLCTSKEEVYSFVDAVLGELAEMTPGPYLHIGGDESDATQKEDYIYFLNRIQKIIQGHGKKMMGWDDIVASDTDSTGVVQFWHSKENIQLAKEKGMKIVFSPAQYAYLDMKYDSSSQYGLNWAGYIEVDKAYNWSPDTLVQGINKEDILGVECPLWTETVSNLDELEYLVFPRLPAYAEIGWSHPENRSWEDFKRRLKAQQQTFEQMQIDYYPSPLIDWKE